MWLYFCSLLYIFPHKAQAVASARVVNNCPYPIYIRSVLASDIGEPFLLHPGDLYTEPYRPQVCYNNIPNKSPPSNCSGVSIKIGKSLSMPSITQFEYTYVPNATPDLYYDISDINDAFPRQFCQYGYTLSMEDDNCKKINCPPNCKENCSAIYNYYNDDLATSGCDSRYGLDFTVCSYC